MTIFDHLRACAANGDMPTLDAEDAARIVKTYDLMLEALLWAEARLEELDSDGATLGKVLSAIRLAREAKR